MMIVRIAVYPILAQSTKRTSTPLAMKMEPMIAVACTLSAAEIMVNRESDSAVSYDPWV
jgi:hypothetical protein